MISVAIVNGGIRSAHRALGWYTTVSAYLLALPMLEEDQVLKEAMGAHQTTAAEDRLRAWCEKSLFCYHLYLTSFGHTAKYSRYCYRAIDIIS